MPARKPLAVPGDAIYQYDGSLKGFYCCVFACVYSGRMPLAIHAPTQAQVSLLPPQWIDTDENRAQRVRDSIVQKVSPRAQELIETVFLSCLAEKEMPLLRFLLLAYQEGAQVTRMLAHPDVATLLKAEQHLHGEAHLLKGFIRFSDHGGRLVAAIRPKNFVLPFLAEHFMERYGQETFLIYDRTHQAALLYERGQGRILPLESLPSFETDANEAQYQALWKAFYHAISITARENPRCRMTHMPKRYWAEMTEMRDLL